jgi:hypothetical protein
MQPDCLKPLASYLGHVNPMALEELELSNLNLSDAAIEDLCLMFRKNTSLTRFKLSNCQVPSVPVLG